MLVTFKPAAEQTVGWQNLRALSTALTVKF